VIGQE